MLHELTILQWRLLFAMCVVGYYENVLDDDSQQQVFLRGPLSRLCKYNLQGLIKHQSVYAKCSIDPTDYCCNKRWYRLPPAGAGVESHINEVAYKKGWLKKRHSPNRPLAGLCLINNHVLSLVMQLIGYTKEHKILHSGPGLYVEPCPTKPWLCLLRYIAEVPANTSSRREHIIAVLHRTV